ncbi:MAG: hypothetical protein IJY50_00035, partial [Clostridia bacterium]|nr:hypothetical protein [Clostridia bacterium]
GQDCAVWAKDGATVNIYDGTFIADGLDHPATSADHQDMIYAGSAGIINISGGFFSARSEGAWLLNEKDNSGILTVTGGTFVNWDPANNVSEGANTSFVADGYASIAHYKANGDIWYEVVESSNKTGVVVEEGVSVDFEAETLEGKVTNKGALSVTGGTLTAATAGVVNNGTATLTDVTMKAGSTADYSNITRGDGAETTYNDVDIVSAGGGIAAADGAQVTVNGGSVAVNTKSTSGRYNFYAVGEGTVITINGGEYSFSKSYNQKRAYIYAGEGATVYVTGGTFGAASTRTGYTAGILGDGEVIITGGTFGFDPSAWVADGYQAVKTGDVWVVSAI